MLGIAGIAGFMALRIWPTSGSTPLKPGAYAVQILQGETPAEGASPDHAANVAVIEGGLAALLGLWVSAQIAKRLSALTTAGANVAPAATAEAGTSETADTGVSNTVESELETDLGTIADTGE